MDSTAAVMDAPKADPFLDTTTIKVMLGEPSAGLIDCIAHDNRLDVYMDYARLEARSKFKFFTGNVGRSGVNYAREMMANEAIDQGMDYLFMIDDDMLLPKRCFERIFATMQLHKADMAAPICTQRVAPYYAVMYRHTTELVNGVNDLGSQFIEDYEPNSVVTVDGFGFGVALISVPFLKKMKEKSFYVSWLKFSTEEDPSLHTIFNTSKVKGGRFSSVDPNYSRLIWK